MVAVTAARDEIGTPFCITVDFDTLEDQAVTIRERDTMSQERVALDQVKSYLAARLAGWYRPAAGVFPRTADHYVAAGSL